MGVGKSVTLLEGLHAIDLRWMPKGVRAGPGGRGKASGSSEMKHGHGPPLDIFRSLARSSGDPHPPWNVGYGAKVKTKNKNVWKTTGD